MRENRLLMDTQRLTKEEIAKAASLIQKGKLVAFPTETVYGLGASIFQLEAIEEIFRVKNRPQDNPLIAHIADLDWVEQVAQTVPLSFYTLSQRFFPGPLTVILKKCPRISGIISGGLETIAVRQPKHPIAETLIRCVGEPLVAPSANLSGRPSSTSAEHVLHDLSGKIAAVIDAGPCSIGIESTVLDLVSFAAPTILRPGMITKEEIMEVLGEEVCLYKEGPMGSPGMKYRHYAPKAIVEVFFSQEELEKYLFLSPSLKRLLLSACPVGHLDWFPLASQTLYALLRDADENHYDEILLLCDEQVRQNDALMNRISHMRRECK